MAEVPVVAEQVNTAEVEKEVVEEPNYEADGDGAVEEVEPAKPLTEEEQRLAWRD